MSVNWVVREYKNGDEQAILELRKIVFGDEDKDKQNIEFWNWEFRDNYAGHAKMYVADDNGKIVGFYAVIPSLYKVGTRNNIIGSIVVDVMTHPDYRFQGMFTKLGRYSLNKSGNEGIVFSTGFPVRKEVMPGHLKVNWKHIMDIPVLAVPVNFKGVSKKIIDLPLINSFAQMIGKPFYNLFINRLNNSKYKSKYKIVKINKFEDEFDLFWEKIKGQYNTIQIRSCNFLNWRFFSNKYRNYEVYKAVINNEVIGFIVMRITDIFGLKCLTIVDVQVLESYHEVIDELLKITYQIAVQKSLDLVGCMISQYNQYYNRMLKLGFLKTPYHFGLITHINNDQITEEELNVPNKLFFTWADTDVI